MLTLQEIRVDTIDVVVFVVLTPVDTFCAWARHYARKKVNLCAKM